MKDVSKAGDRENKHGRTFVVDKTHDGMEAVPDAPNFPHVCPQSSLPVVHGPRCPCQEIRASSEGQRARAPLNAALVDKKGAQRNDSQQVDLHRNLSNPVDLPDHPGDRVRGGVQR